MQDPQKEEKSPTGPGALRSIQDESVTFNKVKREVTLAERKPQTISTVNERYN